MREGSIKSAERTLAIFEYFASKQRPLTIRDISQGLRIPQSSTSALVRALVTLGYLERDTATRTYYPTVRIAILGTWTHRRMANLGRVPDMIVDMAERTGESAILAARNGIHSQYLFVRQRVDIERAEIDFGILRPLACSATGWAILSGEDDAEIGRIVRRTQAEAERPHWRETAALAPEKIALCRERGYALSAGETSPGVGAVAVGVPDRSGVIRFAAGIGGPAERVEAKKDLLVETLRAFAEEFAAELRQGDANGPALT